MRASRLNTVRRLTNTARVITDATPRGRMKVRIAESTTLITSAMPPANHSTLTTMSTAGELRRITDERSPTGRASVLRAGPTALALARRLPALGVETRFGRGTGGLRGASVWLYPEPVGQARAEPLECELSVARL